MSCIEELMREETNKFVFTTIEGISKPNALPTIELESGRVYQLNIDDLYFGVISNSPQWSSLDLKLKKCLGGTYVFFGIEPRVGVSFYIGIAWEYLCKSLKIEKTDIPTFLNKTKQSFINKQTTLTGRHLVFQKEYLLNHSDEVVIGKYFFEVLYDFIAELKNELYKKNPENTRTIEFKKIIKIERGITENFQNTTPTIDEMAKMAGMSVSKFKLLFYEIFETSPHQHILDKKMYYAKALLQTGQFSATQVAYKVGYNHLSGFTRIFKNKFGKLPSGEGA